MKVIVTGKGGQLASEFEQLKGDDVERFMIGRNKDMRLDLPVTLHAQIRGKL